MNEWIVPLAGLLIFLFFVPGCFVWVSLHNRRAKAGVRKASTTGTTLSHTYFRFSVDLP